MGYFQSLATASGWLCGIQNSDGGWGLAPRQGSSLVNTAEALLVLSKANCTHDAIHRGLDFIAGNFNDHISKRGQRLRYAALPLLTIGECYPSWNPEFQRSLIAWIQDGQNADNGWGVEASDRDSNLFSTYLAVMSLTRCKATWSGQENVAQWILSRGSIRGWALDHQQPTARIDEHRSSSVATAYALLALTALGKTDHELVQRGKDILLQNNHWGPEDETIAGTVWRHCTYTHVIQALTSLGIDPFDTVIAEGIRHLNKLESPSVGWEESEFDKTPTVRAQYWAVTAFSGVLGVIDPGIHVPRIDAEHTEDSLLEPEFVKISMHSPWAMIVPTRLYVLIVWTLIVTGVGFAFDALTFLSDIPPAYAATALLFAAWFLIQKRPKKFPRLARVVTLIGVVIMGLSTLFGHNLHDLLIQAKSITTQIIGFALTSFK